MMVSVFIAICAMHVPVESCNQGEALHWIVAPEPQVVSFCAAYGQRYAAHSNLVVEGTYVKVFCRARTTVASGGGPT